MIFSYPYLLFGEFVFWREISVKTKLRLIIHVLLYLMATAVFVYGLSHIINWLRITSSRQFSIHVMFAPPLFTLAVSLIFSYNHIKSLFSTKIKIRVEKLVAAILFLVIILLHVIGSRHQAIVWRYIPMIAYGIEIIWFLFWYNLFYICNAKHEGT